MMVMEMIGTSKRGKKKDTARRATNMCMELYHEDDSLQWFDFAMKEADEKRFNELPDIYKSCLSKDDFLNDEKYWR